MTNCVQKADGTVFRTNISRSGQVYCFNLYTGVPISAQANCAKAAELEHIHMWASYALRARILETRVFDGSGNWTVSGFWVTTGGDRDQWAVKLMWSPAYVSSARPRVCLTLAPGTSLRDLCLGPKGAPPGNCTVALHSIDVKCCPVYALPVPAPAPVPVPGGLPPSPSPPARAPPPS